MRSKLFVSKDNIFYFFGFAIIIISQIFNNSKYGSTVGAMEIPFVLSCLFCILQIVINGFRSNRCISNEEIICAVCYALFSYLVTKFNGVVKWNVDGTSLILCIFLFILMAYSQLTSEKVFLILKFYIAVSILFSFLLIIQFIKGTNFGFDNRATLVILGKIKDPNYLSAFLVPSIAILLLWMINGIGSRKLLFLCLIFVFVGIFVTGSRAAFLTVLIAFVFCMFNYFVKTGLSRKRSIFLLLLLLFLIIGVFILMQTSIFDRLFDLNSYKGNIRLALWRLALNAFKRNPIFGSGFQSGGYYVAEKTIWSASHNCYLDIICNTGIVGAFMILFLFSRLFRVPKNKKINMIVLFIAFYLPLMFINGLNAMTFWFPMAICRQIVGCLSSDDENKKKIF